MENKTLDIIRLIFLSIIAVCLVIIIVVLLNKDFKFDFKESKLDKVYDESFTEEMENIDIDTISSDIKLESSDTDEVKVKIYDQTDKNIEVEVNDKTLKVVNKNDTNPKYFILSINNNPKIVITVPKDNKYNLNIKGVSSDIYTNKDLENVKIETDSGDIDLKDCNELNIKSKSGDIALGKVKSLSLKTVSGDINIDKVESKLKLKTTSGDIKINELSLTKNSSIKATSGDIVIGKVNDIYIDAKTISGDVNIKNNNHKSNIELKIETKSGDIAV